MSEFELVEVEVELAVEEESKNQTFTRSICGPIQAKRELLESVSDEVDEEELDSFAQLTEPEVSLPRKGSREASACLVLTPAPLPEVPTVDDTSWKSPVRSSYK